jgi:hypothetical protein
MCPDDLINIFMTKINEKIDLHQIITEKYGEHFCASPWNSFHEGPKGLVSTCCKSRTPIGWSNKQSFEDMYNSDHAKDTRAKFLRGEKPQQCNACWHQEVKGEPSHNRTHGNRNSNLDDLDTLIAATDPDGTLHEHKPKWLDFLWTNKCNFACLGCTPELSTTINNKYKKEFAVLNKGDSSYFGQMDEWKNSGANKVQYVLDHVDTIDNIHLNGGEPWLSEETYELLEELLKRGLNKKIFIWSHTNGSVTRGYKGVDIVNDYLVHWAHHGMAKVIMSSDGYGDRGEYIRYGYKDKKWLETYNKVRDAKLILNIQTCWNVYNALSVSELGEWYIDNCPPDNTSGLANIVDGSLTIWNNPTTSPDMLMYVPELVEDAKQELRKMISSGKHPDTWKIHMRKWINWFDKEDEFHTTNTENLKAWYDGTRLLDEKRGTDLCKTLPELIPLYEMAKSIT